jgi:O-antigen/teichoic acid export membrane protein
MSIFDFGLSRGLTQIVASSLDALEGSLRTAVWTAQFLTALLGVTAGIAVFLSVPWFVGTAIHLRGSLAAEAIVAFRVLSLGLPLEVSSAGFRGVVEAQQRFDLSNFVRIPMAVLLYAAPLAVLPFTHSLVVVFTVLVLVRIAAWIGYWTTCMVVSPWLGPPHFALRSVIPVARLAGWMSISNFISPLLVYADRFIVAALLSIGAVVYYATPYDVITKALIISAALSSVLFPAFALAFKRDRTRARRLFLAGGKYLIIVFLPLTVAVVALAHDLLQVWLGEGFAVRSTAVLQLLAFGVLANGLAAIPFALIQATGRPDITAKLHLCELVLYLFVLWQATQHLGIVGTALAWTVRVILDMILLHGFAWRLLAVPLSTIARQSAAFLAATVAVGIAAVLPLTQPLKSTAIVLSVAVFATIIFRSVLTQSERATLAQLLWQPKRG